jgi:hypothetical protein
MTTDCFKLRTPTVTLLISLAAVLLLLTPPSRPGASSVIPQGKGGEVVAKPTSTPAPKKTPSKKRSAPAKSSTSSSNTGSNDLSEIAFWETIKTSTDPEDFKSYLKKYPNGQFADLAKNRIKALEAAKPQPSPIPTTTPAASTVVNKPATDDSNKESNASLSETLNWIKENLSTYSRFENGSLVNWMEVTKIEGCVVTIATKHILRGVETKNTYYYKLPLVELMTDGKVTKSDLEFDFYLVANDPVIITDSEYVSEKRATIIPSNTEERANRMAKAFVHALKLCKQKEVF